VDRAGDDFHRLQVHTIAGFVRTSVEGADCSFASSSWLSAKASPFANLNGGRACGSAPRSRLSLRHPSMRPGVSTEVESEEGSDQQGEPRRWSKRPHAAHANRMTAR